MKIAQTILRMALVVVFLAACEPSEVEKQITTKPPGDTKQIIELSLTLDPKSGASVINYGSEVVSNLANEGIFAKIPSFQPVGYTHFYIPKKNVRVLGAQLVVYEAEFSEGWLGCCVNPGNAVVLYTESDTAHIKNFARANKCRVTEGEGISFDDGLSKVLNMSRKTKSRLIEVSCKENDRRG